MTAEKNISEDLLNQLPEKVRAILRGDHKLIEITEIIAFYGENGESFMLAGFPDRRKFPESIFEDFLNVNLKSNALGYVLTALLNIDYESVAKIVSNMKWEEPDSDECDQPLNWEDIYNQLLSVSDVFGFYLPTEWREIQCAFEDVLYNCVAHIVARLQKYITFCNRKQMPYNGPFYNFLISSGYFGVEPFMLSSIGRSATMEKLYNDVIEYGGTVDEAYMDKIYDEYVKNLNHDTAESNVYSLEPLTRLRDIAMISFNEITKRGKTIRQCQNCGKYFIPAKRSDTLYCDNPSPEAPEMTCKEYGNRRLWYERQKEDELAALSRKIASAKCMLAKRNPDIPQYVESYEYFKAQRRIWIKATKEGTRTREEYKKWLLSMQNQKIIKEAVNGNH